MHDLAVRAGSAEVAGPIPAVDEGRGGRRRIVEVAFEHPCRAHLDLAWHAGRDLAARVVGHAAPPTATGRPSDPVVRGCGGRRWCRKIVVSVEPRPVITGTPSRSSSARISSVAELAGGHADEAQAARAARDGRRRARQQLATERERRRAVADRARFHRVDRVRRRRSRAARPRGAPFGERQWNDGRTPFARKPGDHVARRRRADPCRASARSARAVDDLRVGLRDELGLAPVVPGGGEHVAPVRRPAPRAIERRGPAQRARRRACRAHRRVRAKREFRDRSPARAARANGCAAVGGQHHRLGVETAQQAGVGILVEPRVQRRERAARRQDRERGEPVDAIGGDAGDHVAAPRPTARQAPRRSRRCARRVRPS